MQNGLGQINSGNLKNRVAYNLHPVSHIKYVYYNVAYMPPVCTCRPHISIPECPNVSQLRAFSDDTKIWFIIVFVT